MTKNLEDLCERIGKVTGQPVMDETGLTGRYVMVLTKPSSGLDER